MCRFPVAMVFALAVLYTPHTSPQSSRVVLLNWHGNWVETDSETLWRNRYANEDYGYAVVLGHGVIGHGTHSPSPNHGFMVPLPEVHTESYVSGKRARVIWVDASYDVLEYEQPNVAMSDHYVHSAVLGGRHAVETTSLTPSPDGSLIGDSIVVRRCGIVYTVSMQTSPENRLADKRQFDEIVRGFRFLKIPARECVSSR